MRIGRGEEGVGVRLDSEGEILDVSISSFDVFRFFWWFFSALRCNSLLFFVVVLDMVRFFRIVYFFLFCSYLHGTYLSPWLALS